MSKIKVQVLESRKLSNGKFKIYLGMFHKGEVRYISLPYVIDDLYQIEDGVVVCRKDAKIMNQRIKYELSYCQDKLDGIQSQHIYSCAQLKEMLEGKAKQDSFITIKEYMEMRIVKMRKEGSDSYADMNEYTLSKIIKILGDVTLASLTPATIDYTVSNRSYLFQLN